MFKWLFRRSERTIFSGFGIRILKRDCRYYIEYDGGRINIEMRQDRITKSEARKARRGEQDAAAVIIAAQNRGKSR